MARRDRRFHRVADHIVEVMIHQALPLGKADGMDEDHYIERLCLGKELVEPEARIREIETVDTGIDFHAAQAQSLHAALELDDGQIDFLQRYGT